MSIRELIAQLDGNEKLIKLKIGDIYIWPLIRFDVIQAIINHQSSLDEPNKKVLGKSSGRSLRALLRSLVFSMPNFLSRRKTKYLFFTNELSTVPSGDGLFYNRVSEYFFDLIDSDALVIERSGDFTLKPRRHQRIMSSVALTLDEKLTAIFEKRNEILIESLVQQILKIVLGIIPDFNEISQWKLKVKLSGQLNFRGVLKAYHRFLKRKNPEVIFVEDAHYGGRAALLTLAAKRLGIKVAEPQHGFVNENHPSYNFGKGVLEHKELCQYYPDFFLTYGAFWSNATSVPNMTVEIGNPHLMKNIRLFPAHKISQEQTILVSGSGVSIKETNQLLTKLVLKNQAHQVIYRPHPMERSMVQERYAEPIRAGILIDINPNVYESIMKADLVISELSTVLFESIALKKNTKLYMSSYTLAYHSDSLKYLESFYIDDLDTLFDFNKAKLDQAYKYYWIENWEDAFRQFLITFEKK
jgi:uncharacterized membrane protein